MNISNERRIGLLMRASGFGKTEAIVLWLLLPACAIDQLRTNGGAL
jgi:hypothetical protein